MVSKSENKIKDWLFISIILVDFIDDLNFLTLCPVQYIWRLTCASLMVRKASVVWRSSKSGGGCFFYSVLTRQYTLLSHCLSTLLVYKWVPKNCRSNLPELKGGWVGEVVACD